MNTYLFTWNPLKWPWQAYAENAANVTKMRKVVKDWRCISHKRINPGDRAFVMKVGNAPKGLISSGTIVSHPFLARHRKIEGREIYLVTVEFDTLLDSGRQLILTPDILNLGKLAKQNWTPQASGISIRPELVEELEAIWQDFLTST